MKKLVIFLLAIALMPSLQSCRKKEEPKPSAKELITMDDWTFVKREIYDANGDLANTMTAHNKWVLTQSNDYFFYDNNGAIYDYGTWKLLDNDKKIEFIQHDAVYDQIFDIDKLTKSNFTFSITSNTGAKAIIYLER